MRDFLFVCCEAGHSWKIEGGRPCPFFDQGSPCPVMHVLCSDRVNCSQPVFRCEKCGEYDYGTDPKGPGYEHCNQCTKDWTP